MKDDLTVQTPESGQLAKYYPETGSADNPALTPQAVILPEFGKGPVPATGRVTVLETVYHQMQGANPTASESKYSIKLETDEQPYVRKGKVGKEWIPLELGWLKDGCSLLCLANDEGLFLQVQPTPEEKANLEAKIIQVSLFNVAFAIIRPGRSIRLEPLDIQYLRIRCRSGFAKYTLSLFPL